MLVLKVADFGFARFIESPQSLVWTCCGSPLYMAPEVLNLESYTEKADLWSVGVILFEMLAGYAPFYAKNQIDLYRRILSSDFVELPASVIVQGQCKDLLSRLLQVDSKARISWGEFFHHSWLNSTELLPWNPPSNNLVAGPGTTAPPRIAALKELCLINPTGYPLARTPGSKSFMGISPSIPVSSSPFLSYTLSDKPKIDMENFTLSPFIIKI